MGKRILVAHKSRQELDTINRRLKNYGCEEIESVQTAKETLKRVRSSPPGLVIVSTDLLDGNGYDVCRKIKEMNLDGMKIILLNGLAEMNSVRRAIEARADDFVLKTADYLFLIDAVKRMLPVSIKALEKYNNN